MARFDKVEPLGGSFRAALAADWAAADGIPIGVGLDNTGKVVPGAGNTGILGVVVLVGIMKKAGDIVDVMTDGEIVELTSPALTAGTVIFGVAATGVLTATASGNVRLGHTVAATRLIVRAAR